MVKVCQVRVGKTWLVKVKLGSLGKVGPGQVGLVQVSLGWVGRVW